LDVEVWNAVGQFRMGLGFVGVELSLIGSGRRQSLRKDRVSCGGVGGRVKPTLVFESQGFQRVFSVFENNSAAGSGRDQKRNPSQTSTIVMSAAVAVGALVVSASAAGLYAYRRIVNALLSSLPETEGKFIVGASEFMCEKENLLVRVFYPTDLKKLPPPDSRSVIFNSAGEKNPSVLAKAYATHFGVPAFLWPLFRLLGFCRISAAPNARLSTATDRFPVMIFSHGLAGVPTLYSTFCVDMASHGYFVVGIEHSDGSSVASIRPDGSILKYRNLKDHVSDESDKLAEYRFRNGQLQYRVQEMKKVLDWLDDLNSGVRRERLDLKGRLDLSDITASGHSFGAATALEACAVYPNTFNQCIALDSWMFPVSKESYDILRNQRVRSLFINNEYFQWRKNLEMIDLLSHREQVTLLGSTHYTQSDVLMFLPERILGIVGLPKLYMDPVTAVRVNNRLAISFLDFRLDEFMKSLPAEHASFVRHDHGNAVESATSADHTLSEHAATTAAASPSTS